MSDHDAPDAVTKVARDLTEILDLAGALETQIVHKANDPLMPGGLSMVALGGVASPEAWENVYEAAERLERPTEHVADEDDDWTPPLQLILFWSEQLRVEHNRESDRRPTLASEVAFVRESLNWLWDNEPHFHNFAEDVRTAKRRLENLLYAGERVELGVPCMYDECRGARLVRQIDDHGRRTDWRCPRCEREWDEDRYAQMVTAAHEASKFEDIDGVTWCSIDYAARMVARSVKTIRTWVNRKEVATACIIAGQRVGFVSLNEVRLRDDLSKRRRSRAA